LENGVQAMNMGDGDVEMPDVTPSSTSVSTVMEMIDACRRIFGNNGFKEENPSFTAEQLCNAPPMKIMYQEREYQISYMPLGTSVLIIYFNNNHHTFRLSDGYESMKIKVETIFIHPEILHSKPPQLLEMPDFVLSQIYQFAEIKDLGRIQSTTKELQIPEDIWHHVALNFQKYKISNGRKLKDEIQNQSYRHIVKEEVQKSVVAQKERVHFEEGMRLAAIDRQLFYPFPRRPFVPFTPFGDYGMEPLVPSPFGDQANNIHPSLRDLTAEILHPTMYPTMPRYGPNFGELY